MQNNKKDSIQLRLKKALKDEQSGFFSDELRLRQILTNLLSNAVKFTQSGTITFGYEQMKTNTLQFFVEDTGQGIPREKQKVIFNRFRQANDSIAGGYSGTGLGLSISMNLVGMLGGKIWVESEKDRGSRFLFTLPYQPMPQEQEKEVFQSLQEHPNKYNGLFASAQILLIEDDPISREFINEILVPTQVTIHNAENGEKGLQVFQKYKHQLSLILMDLRLPDISGFALAEDRKKSLKAGCNDYLPKPIDQNTLLTILSHYLS